MGEICASCLTFDMNKIVKSKQHLTPKWLNETNYVRDFIGNNKIFKNRYPKKFNVKMKLNVGKEHFGKKILYWATKEKNGDKSNQVVEMRLSKKRSQDRKEWLEDKGNLANV